MLHRLRFLWSLAVLSLLMACVSGTPSPVPPTATPVATGPCVITAEAGVTVYDRPSTSAQVFGTLSPGDTYQAAARTADGWLGFEPGVAQAANMGVFRYRWVPENAEGLTLQGECGALPVVVGPAPEICYDMPMETVVVYESPSLSSPELAIMVPNDYAAIIGKISDGSWYKVDLNQGNTGLSVIGWVDGTTINMNGPCNEVPIVVP